MPRVVALVIALVAATALVAIAWRPAETQPPPGPVAVPTRGIGIEILLGVGDAEPTEWNGELAVSPGQVVGLIAGGAAEDRVEGARWQVRSRRQGQGQNAIVRPARLLAVVDAPADALLTVTTSRGQFAVRLGELAFGQRRAYLSGAAVIARVPLAVPVVTGPTEDDYSAAAIAPDGRVWIAWVSYRSGTPVQVGPDTRDFSSLVTQNHGDQIQLASYDGRDFSAPIAVTPPQLDVWRPAVACDGRGGVWVIWSQNRDGNWDLMARRYDPAPGRWGRTLPLTSAPGADIHPAAFTDRAGAVWVAWMGWRRGNFDLLLRRVEGGREIALTRTAANEWNPVAAVDSSGVAYVAFDTYDAGNYDVRLVRDATSRQPQTIAVTTSDQFEARPSLAIDARDRVWIAYETAGPNWGKDHGQRWAGPQGEPFYLQRNIAVRIYAGGQLQAPAGDLDANLTPRLRIRKSIPRIAIDRDGRVWLAFRHHGTSESRGTDAASFNQEVWSSWVVCYQGNQWSAAIPIPNSANLLDQRTPLVPLPTGGVLMVYSTDRRDVVGVAQQNNDLHLALLRMEESPAPAQLTAASPPPPPTDPIHPAEAEEVARMRDFRVRIGGKTYRLVRGEFHRHTEMSSHRDQDGPLEEMWRYALDVAKLDWIGNGDHMNGGREYKWWIVQKTTDIFHHPPLFVGQHTYERSTPYPNGHRNVMFARRGIRPLPFGNLQGTPEAGTPDTKQLYAYLRFFDGICASHTSATGMGTDWRDNDPLVEPVVEIYQGHRQNYEHPGAPMSNSAEDSIGGYQPAGYVWNALAKGYRLGFQVSSDHVSTHLSYAVALVERNDRREIVDAFKRRRCYGANDNIVLIVTCGDRLMGEEFTTRERPRLRIYAIGTHPIARVDIVKNNTYALTLAPHEQRIQLTWEDAAAEPGKTSYYYVRIQQANGAIAWASPMWIRYEP